MYVPAEALEGVSTGHWKSEEGRRGSLLKLQKCLTLPLSRLSWGGPQSIQQVLFSSFSKSATCRF